MGPESLSKTVNELGGKCSTAPSGVCRVSPHSDIFDACKPLETAINSASESARAPRKMPPRTYSQNCNPHQEHPFIGHLTEICIIILFLSIEIHEV